LIDDVLLRRIAIEERVPLGTIEKDLAISCALHAISGSRLRDHLVFKGGTAIKKFYQPDARFSEDMDFTVLNQSEDEAIYALKKLFQDKQVETVSFGEVYEERFSQAGRRIRLPFTGPLRYRNSVRIDLSFRDDIILETGRRTVLHRYGDTLPSEIHILDFTEIIAEKLRALMERGYSRDYYDIWKHIDKITDKSSLRELTARKCTLIGIEYSPTTIFDENILQRVESTWRTQLQHLLPDYVEFRAMLSDLKDRLKFLEHGVNQS
jgi:predicted nucleotidyltransferase component of viral defense system